MLKKITFGGLFLFATLLISTAAQSRTTASSATIDSPKAPVGQGLCPYGGRCSTTKIDAAPKAPVGRGFCPGMHC